MGDRNMKYPQLDPVAEVLLDFQSVMGQFLELQTEMMAGHRARQSRSRAAEPLEVAQIAQMAAIEAAVAPVLAEPARPAPEPSQLETQQPVRQQPAAIQSASDAAAFSRYTVSARERPLG